MDNEPYVKSLEQIKNPYEKEIAELLARIGLKFVAANSEFGEKAYERIGEIDLIFTDKNDTVFILEVSANNQSANRRKKRQVFRKWQIEENTIKIVKKHKLDERSKIYFVYIDLSRPENTDKNVNREDPTTKSIIVYDHELKQLDKKEDTNKAEEFRTLVSSIDEQLKNKSG